MPRKRVNSREEGGKKNKYQRERIVTRNKLARL
jgi:hypothetical protein